MRIIGNAEKAREVQAVASGVLPSGVPVIVNADGTVSVIAGSSLSEGVGSASIFESANSTYLDSAFDSTNNKFIVAYQDSGNSQRGTAVVGTVSGNSISFGTPVVFQSSTIEYCAVVHDSTNNKIVVFYHDAGSTNYGKAIVGTVSGTSISFGTAVVFASVVARSNFAAFDSGNGKVVNVYRNSSANSAGDAVVGTVSGTSISFGSSTNWSPANQGYGSVTYIGSSKFLIGYTGSSDAGTALVATLSGTSLSYGSSSEFRSYQTFDISSAYDSSTGKAVMVYRDNFSNGRVAVATISGTSVSFGSDTIFAANGVVSSGDTSKTAISYDSTNDKMVISYQDNSNSNYGTIIVGTVSGTSISFGTPVVFEAASTNYTTSAFDTNSGKVVIAYRDQGNSNYGTSVVFQNANVTTNLTSENYIGMSGGVVKTLSQSEAIGTESTFETGAVYESSSGYHVAEKKTLLMFRDASDSNKIKGRLVTTTGTTLSYGSIVELTGQVGGPGSVVYDSVNEKLVVIFRGNTNYTYAVVATISGSSLTFGTPVVFNSATSYVYEGVYDSTSGKIVVLYSAASVSYLKVGTVSGTSISFGSATSLGSGSGMYSGKLAYDPVNNKTIYVQVNDINSDGIAYVGTVSGTSISVGSPTTFNSNLASIYGAFYDAPSGKIGVIVQTGPGPGEGYVGTVSGTSISFGSGVQFQSGISQGTTGYDSRVNKFTVACRSINSPYPGLLRLGTISGNTFSFASPVTFNSGETSPHSVGFDSDQGTSIISFMDGGDGDVGKAIGFQASGSYVVTSEVADGDKAEINIKGAVDENQSGLTAGQSYYVQIDGTLGTTPADPSVFAGTAVAATKLIVKG